MTAGDSLTDVCLVV